MNFRTTPQKAIEKFESKHIEAEFLDTEGIHFVKTGIENSRLILFIHGTPGSSDAFYNYLSDSVLQTIGALISVDRIGYGYSSLGKSETSIIKQTASLLPIIRGYEEVYTVGHSYGGPIAAYLAILEPDKIKGVLMLAPTIEPVIEKYSGLSAIGNTLPFRWMISKAWRVAAEEKLSHKEELEKIKKEWIQIQCPVIHMHAEDDALVPFSNTVFSKNYFPASTKIITLSSGNHFLPWNSYQLVKDEIILMTQ